MLYNISTLYIVSLLYFSGFSTTPHLSMPTAPPNNQQQQYNQPTRLQAFSDITGDPSKFEPLSINTSGVVPTNLRCSANVPVMRCPTMCSNMTFSGNPPGRCITCQLPCREEFLYFQSLNTIIVLKTAIESPSLENYPPVFKDGLRTMIDYLFSTMSEGLSHHSRQHPHKDQSIPFYK